MGRILALDVGGTKIRHCVYEKGRASRMACAATDRNMDSKGLLRLIKSLADECRPDAVCVSIAGFVKDGAVIGMPNVPKISRLSLASKIKKMTGAHAFVENDVKCMALAHWHASGARKDANFALVAPGSGIGGAIVYEGRLVRGSHNTAGEFGHMAMAAGADARFYDFESLAGGLGISRIYFAKTGSKSDAKSVMDRYRDGNATGITLWAARYFGAGLASIANMLDPKEIVVAGSVGRAYCSKKLIAEVKKAYLQNAIGTVKKTSIYACTTCEPALEGAILLAFARKDKKIAEFLGK